MRAMQTAANRTGRRRCVAPVSLACVALAVLAAPALAVGPPMGFRVTGGLSVGYDNNLLATQASAEKEGSALYSAMLAGDGLWRVSERFSLVLRGQLQGDVYERFEDLSTGKALLMLRANFKPARNFYSPLLTGWVSSGLIESGSEIRSGEEMRGGVLLTQPLNTRLGLRAELKGFRRRGEGQVFDLSGQSALLGLNWEPGPLLQARLHYEYQTGEQHSSGLATLRNTSAARVIEPDDAFGGLAANVFAYRLDADTQMLTAGFNYRLTHKLSLDGQLQSISVDADQGNEYWRMVGIFGLLMRF